MDCITQCDDGWVELNTDCFYFHQETRMPWQDARTLCQELGKSDLAIIDRPNTLREIYMYLVKYDLHDPFWIAEGHRGRRETGLGWTTLELLPGRHSGPFTAVSSAGPTSPLVALPRTASLWMMADAHVLFQRS
ncbi:lectin A isoform 1 [Penaeus vannamei]|uniref:Lectin A isoform 1 n=1 Tax=Penaeus vannamei TaxID=6689 RepID=A0A3R7M3U8_PENVA|nr:lectin A isoform 1 [Penaeus vannamei]